MDKKYDVIRNHTLFSTNAFTKMGNGRGKETMKKALNSITLRLLLRSVYLKGHQDGNMKVADMSWEDKMISDITKIIEEL